MTDNNPEVLKPCPFCGGQPKSYWQGDSSECGDDGYWAVECCDTHVHRDDEAEAITAWNTRPSPIRDAVADAEGVALKKAIVGLENAQAYFSRFSDGDFDADAVLAEAGAAVFVALYDARAALRTANTGRAEVLEEAARVLDELERSICGSCEWDEAQKLAFGEAARQVRALSSPPVTTAPGGPYDFQLGVDRWMDQCFGEPIKSDQLERADRFTEEALELAQTMPGFTKDRAHALVDYVFDRPQGEINQEVGGVMVTLAALCNTTGVRIDEAAATELARIWTKVEQIRAKQAAKPTGSALPIAAPDEGIAPAVPDEAEGWRPIETFDEPTAPSSGNGVLISAGGVVGEAYYRNFGDNDDGWWWANTSWGDYPEPDRPNPTHWRPLPPPAGEDAGEAGK